MERILSRGLVDYIPFRLCLLMNGLLPSDRFDCNTLPVDFSHRRRYGPFNRRLTMTAEKNDHRPEAAGKPEDLSRAEWFCSWRFSIPAED
jgi:hypothetical protein